MNLVIRCVALIAASMLCACGGGGGAGGGSASTSISVTPTSLSFKANTQDDLKSANVTATFDGDGLVVGFLPGAVVPAWLSLVETGHTSSRATFAVNVYPSSLTPGTYSTTLRFATGRVDSQGNVSEIRTSDVPLTLIVAQLSLSPSTLSLETPLGSNTNLTGTLSLQIANGRAWTAADTQPWLTVRPSGTGPGLIDYTINPSGLALGSHTATVTVTDPDQATDTTAITLAVRVPRLTANPAAPVLTVDTDNASTTQTLHITDELDGNTPASAISWNVQSISAAWLRMTPASGSSVPGVDATLSLAESQLATMANGTYTGSVVLVYNDAGNQPRTLTVPVTLNLDSPLKSISVTPGPVQRIAGEAPVQFTATGTYATGYSANVTGELDWTSSSAVVSIGNGGAQAKGLGVPVTPGTATVTAAMPETSVSGTATFVVIPPLGNAYINGIYSSGFDQYYFGDDGQLHPIHGHDFVSTGEPVGSTRLAPSGNYAYAIGSQGIHQFKVAAGGYLEPMSPAVVPGSAATYFIAMDPSEQYFYASGYNASNDKYVIRQYRIGSDGRLSPLSPASIVGNGRIEVRSTGGYVYAANGNGITAYSIGADGTLTQAGATTRGPDDLRDFTLHPSGGAAYIVSQYYIWQYAIDANGAVTPMSPPSVGIGTTGSHVVVDVTGQHAYGIDSYYDKIAHYTIGADYKLTFRSQSSDVPYTPIDVKLEPSGQYLYITGNNDVLAKFTLDENGDVVGGPVLMSTVAYPRGLAVRAGQ